MSATGEATGLRVVSSVKAVVLLRTGLFCSFLAVSNEDSGTVGIGGVLLSSGRKEDVSVVLVVLGVSFAMLVTLPLRSHKGVPGIATEVDVVVAETDLTRRLSLVLRLLEVEVENILA